MKIKRMTLGQWSCLHALQMSDQDFLSFIEIVKETLRDLYETTLNMKYQIDEAIFLLKVNNYQNATTFIQLQ